MNGSRRDRGIALARRLFGDTMRRIEMPKRFRRWTVEHVFGEVWQGGELTLEERSLVTCTILMSLAREDELRLHLTGARNLGIPREKLEAIISHAAHYAGWPVAVGAFRALEEVWPPGQDARNPPST